jgi:hypothetical protein
MDTISLEIEAGPEVPEAKDVNPADLPKIIANASSPRLEVMARRNYWRHLNDDYRDQYRAHRAVEDATANTWWRRLYRASLTTLQRASRKLLVTKPKPAAQPKRPFTVPTYNPTAEQLDNMKRLLTLVLDGAEESFKIDWLEVAELYRERGDFEQAQDALSRCNDDQQGVTWSVISNLVDARSIGPVRFRM